MSNELKKIYRSVLKHEKGLYCDSPRHYFNVSIVYILDIGMLKMESATGSLIGFPPSMVNGDISDMVEETIILTPFETRTKR